MFSKNSDHIGPGHDVKGVKQFVTKKRIYLTTFRAKFIGFFSIVTFGVKIKS
jgi:hypothetical protein